MLRKREREEEIAQEEKVKKQKEWEKEWEVGVGGFDHVSGKSVDDQKHFGLSHGRAVRLWGSNPGHDHGTCVLQQDTYIASLYSV